MRRPRGAHDPRSVVEGFIIFLVAYFVVVQFVLPRFGIRPG
jgi:hypothetical protein